jgi:hypothetical protein
MVKLSHGFVNAMEWVGIMITLYVHIREVLCLKLAVLIEVLCPSWQILG